MNRMRRLIAALTVLPFTGAAAPASAKDLAAMTPDEIRVLQQRLTDAKCYKGPIDGKASPATEAAEKSCPDQDPVLRIETGMHTAVIRGIAVDAACTVIATASEDKTVRLWSLPDGKLKQTIRLPIDGQEGGRARAVALSPDGRWLAAAGWDAANGRSGKHGLYLTDLVTGSVRHLGAFENVVFGLAASSDGRRVAAALKGNDGVRVLEVGSGRELMADRNYGDDSYGVAFDGDGGLVTASYDGFIRRYGADLKLRYKRAAPAGKQPFGVTVDPSGGRVGIGYYDGSKVSILDAATGAPLATADNADVGNSNFLAVAWNRDGRLWAGGRASLAAAGKWSKVLRQFSRDGARSGDVILDANNTVMDLKPCGDGMAFAGADPSFGLVSAGSKSTTLRHPVTADMRHKIRGGFKVSEDGRVLRFGLGYGDENPIRFDLADARLEPSPSVEHGLSVAKLVDLPVSDWQNATKPFLADRPLALDAHEVSRSLAVRPASDGFVLGTDWWLRAFDAAGKPIWRTSVPGTAWGVNLAQDGKLVVAALDDGTIRWYRWSDGKELLALFVHAPDKRWVAWTPSGYYMASPGGEDLFGWHMNRGWEQPPDFFPASRFRDRYSRPDIVQKVLVTLDEDKAVAEANAEARRKPTEATPIETRLPPVVRITSPKDGSGFTGPTVTLDYGLRSPSGLPVDAIDVLIDGRPLSSTRGGERVDEAAQAACPGITTRGLARSDAGGPTSEVICRLTVPVPSRAVEIGLIARSGQITSVPALVRLTAAAGSAVTADVLKPKLYILAVGISDYADPNLTLRYAGADAVAFAKSFEAQKGGIYREVVTRVLTDRDAGRVAILEGLEWLEHQVTARDVAMVFLAGHGMPDEKGSFWYLPADAKPSSLRSSAVSQEELRRTLQSIPSKAILFLDACHAGKAAGAVASQTRGQVDINTLVNELSSSENGVVTFASSTGRELSEEHADWGHGAFTKALVEGIGEGKANLLQKGTITLSELDAYVVERVKTLTAGRQHSVMTRPATISNFPVALAK